MGKSCSPTVRALDELKNYHTSQIDAYEGETCDMLRGEINKISKESEKASVELVVKAINALKIPFKLEHTTLCNIRQYNGNLSFVLSFDDKKHPDAAKLSKELDGIYNRRNAAKKRLDEWYIKSLYDIAGRSNVKEFVLK